LKRRTENNKEDLCTVVFRLKNGRSAANSFVYALACKVEQWKDVEVVSLDVGELHYQNQTTEDSVQGDVK